MALLESTLLEDIQNNGDAPALEYRTIIDDSGGSYVNRLLVGTPTTGLVRMEWVAARYGQIIPMNWSYVQVSQFINSYIPLRYQVADAQNIIVGQVIAGGFEWLLLNEHDTMLPPDAFIRFNKYILEEQVPVVSGLYFTRSHPSLPLVFRGRGTSIYTKWKLGDRIWVDGVPTGALLIHAGILREMWNDAEEYEVQGAVTRRVFDTPRDLWFDPEFPGVSYAAGGTSDLDWCTRVMEGDYLKRAGWKKIARKKNPFLIDTQIFCPHINNDGEQFPSQMELDYWKPKSG